MSKTRMPTACRMPALPYVALEKEAIALFDVSWHPPLLPKTVYFPIDKGDIFVFLWAIYTVN